MQAAAPRPPQPPHPQPPHPQPPYPGFQPNEPWLIQGQKRRRKFPAALVFMVVGALVVAGGASVGLYALLSGSNKPADKTSTNADAVFVSAANATADGNQQTIADVGAVGDTVVAAGAENGSSLSRPRFLVSQDAGRTWDVADIKTETGARPGGASPYKIVGTPGAWLAVGRTSDHFAAWSSTDGRSWLKLRDGDSAFRSDDQLQQIAKSEQTYIAIGYKTTGDKAKHAIIWLSSDGRSWQRMEGDKLKLPTGGGSVSQLNYVAAVGQNIVISGDIQRSKGEDSIGALWRSADRGRTWKSIEPPQSDGAFGAIHITTSQAGFFALRKAKNGAGRAGQVSQSDDGATWRTAGEFPLSAGESENFQLLAGSDRGLAALVTGPGNRISVYRSGDGASWQQPATDLGEVEGRIIGGLAVTGGGTTIVGGSHQKSDYNFYLNRIDESGRPADIDLASVPGAVNSDRSVQAIVTAGGRTVAVGGTNGDAASWTSVDGVTWNRSETSALSGTGAQSFTELAQGARGWIAVGKDGAKPMIATSADASSWQRLEDPALISAEDTRTLSSVASGPKGYVIVGWKGTVAQESSAAAWQSSDLRTWKRADEADLKSAKNSWPRMLDTASTATGYVAVGEAVNPNAPAAERIRPEVWTSPDGLQWKAQRPELPDRMVNGRLTHVSVNGPIITALGKGWAVNDGYRAFAIVSTDSGLTWSAQRLSLPATAGPAEVTVTALTATSTGFAAVGTVDVSGNEDVVLWASADGRSWQSVKPQGPLVGGAGVQRITGLTVVNNKLLGVGLTADSRTQHLTLWRGPAS